MAYLIDPENLPKHVTSLTKHSELLRTTLADGIKSVVLKLKGRFVVYDYQLKNILETAKTQPEDGVSLLIDIIKQSQEHFDLFIQCLNDMGYTGLVAKLTETVTKRPTSEQKLAKKRKTGEADDDDDDDDDDDVQSEYVASKEEPIVDIIPAIHSNEPMHENHRHKIQKHMSYLVGLDIDPLILITQLHSLFVFDKDEFNELFKDLKANGRISCMAMMLLKLYDKGTSSYIHFLVALERCNYKWIIKKLEPDCGMLNKFYNYDMEDVIVILKCSIY